MYKPIFAYRTFLFGASLMPISEENRSSDAAETQWLNLFHFGIIHCALNEGQRPDADTSNYFSLNAKQIPSFPSLS